MDLTRKHTLEVFYNFKLTLMKGDKVIEVGKKSSYIFLLRYRWKFNQGTFNVFSIDICVCRLLNYLPQLIFKQIRLIKISEEFISHL